MTRLVVEVAAGHKTPGGFYIFDSQEVRVGRGFKNDLILNDSYVSENHLLISRQGAEIRVKDLSTKNGTTLVRLNRKIQETAVVSGEELLIGSTRIRIFDESHQSRPARLLRPKNRVVLLMAKPVFSWISVLFLLALGLLGAFLKTDSSVSFVKLLPVPIFTLILVMLWSGLWSFVGRLTRHKIRFSIHLSYICLFFIFLELLLAGVVSIEFYSNQLILPEILQLIVCVGLTIVLLSGSFGVATNMRAATRNIVSTTFAVLLFAAAIGLTVAYQPYYLTGRIPYSKTLKPPLIISPSGQSIDQFLDRADRAFQFDLEEEE